MLPPRALPHAAAVLDETRQHKPKGRKKAAAANAGLMTISELPGADDYEKIASAQLLMRYGLLELTKTKSVGKASSRLDKKKKKKKERMKAEAGKGEL